MTVTTIARVPKDLALALKRFCKREGYSQQGAVSKAIREMLEREKNGKGKR